MELILMDFGTMQLNGQQHIIRLLNYEIKISPMVLNFTTF